MYRLIKYECDKIFSKKIIYIALLLFLTLNFINIYNSLQVNDYNLYKIPKELQKPITQEAVNDATAFLNSYNGFSYYNAPNEIKKKHNTYTAIIDANNLKELHMKEKKDLNKHLQISELRNKSSYDYRNKSLHYKLMNKLQTPYIHNEQGFREIIHYLNRYGFIYVSVMIILGISTVISSEYATNMYPILKSCKKGKKQLITAKIYASIIYTSMISIFFTIFNTLPYITVLAKYGWNVPIQNIDAFNLSPYNLTIGQYFIIQFLVHLLGAIIFTMIVLLVSSIFKSIITSVYVGGALWALPLIIEQYTYMKNKPKILDYSLTTIIKAEPLFVQYKTVNLLGYPVLYPYLILAIYIILVPIIIYSIYYTFKNKQVV